MAMIYFEIHKNTKKKLEQLFRFILMSIAFKFPFSIFYVFSNVYM